MAGFLEHGGSFVARTDTVSRMHEEACSSKYEAESNVDHMRGRHDSAFLPEPLRQVYAIHALRCGAHLSIRVVIFFIYI